MFKLKSLVAAAAVALSSVAAQAAVLLVDDFNTPAGGASGQDALGGGETLLFTHSLPSPNLASERSIYQNTTALPLTTSTATVSVGGADGILQVAHSGGADSTVRVTWTIDAFTLPPGPSSLLFNVLFSDNGVPNTTDNSLSFSFTAANPADSFATGLSIPPTNADLASLALTAAQAAALAGGGTLELIMNGTPAWEIGIDQFSITIPEPATLALVGLTLVGAGIATRRRKAA